MVGGVSHFRLASASTCRHYIRSLRRMLVVVDGVCVFLSGGRGGEKPVVARCGCGCEDVWSRTPMFLQWAGPNGLEFPAGGVKRLWGRVWAYEWS